MSVEVFTNGVISSRSLIELQINCGLCLIWSTEERREMQMVVPKMTMASSSMRMILNHRWVRSSFTPRKKYVDSRYIVE